MSIGPGLFEVYADAIELNGPSYSAACAEVAEAYGGEGVTEVGVSPYMLRHAGALATAEATPAQPLPDPEQVLANQIAARAAALEDEIENLANKRGISYDAATTQVLGGGFSSALDAAIWECTSRNQ
jgi:hypothetical protein